MGKGKRYISTKIAPALRRGVLSSRRALARARYADIAKDLRVIVVTGSPGATTVARFSKELLEEAHFKTAFYDHSSVKESDSDQSLTSFFKEAKAKNADYVIVSVSVEGLDDPKIDGIMPEVVIVANQGVDLKSAEASSRRLAELKRLFKKKPRYVVIGRDDFQFSDLWSLPVSEQKMSYGKHEDSEARIDRVKNYPKGAEVDVILDHRTHLELATFLLGDDNVYNLTAATALGYMLGVKLEDIQEGIANIE